MDKNTLLLLIIPSISALIGWITNFIAVKMIFRPRKEISILGLKIQGLMPKRKSDLARKIGETVENELISHADIKNAINTPEVQNEILDTVATAIEKFINEKLAGNPMVSMMLSGGLLDQIKDSFKEEMRTVLPELIDKMFAKMGDQLDLKDIVTKKIEGFDMSKLEEIVYKISAKELKAIEVLGGVLGFVVGLVQVGLIYMTNGTM